MRQDPFIKLTTITNDTAHVLYNSIVILKELRNATHITLFGGTTLNVKESAEDIKKAIDKASSMTFVNV